jgi:hypothetical protein
VTQVDREMDLQPPHSREKLSGAYVPWMENKNDYTKKSYLLFMRNSSLTEYTLFYLASSFYVLELGFM